MKHINPRLMRGVAFVRADADDPKKALDDPEVCTREAVKLLRISLRGCSKHPLDDRLAQFTSGRCDRGIDASRYRMFLASKLLREHPVPPPSEPANVGTAQASAPAEERRAR